MMKLILLILSIPLSVVAQAPVQSPAPRTNEPTTGTISGRVVNEAGQPMAGASTFVRAVNSIGAGRTTLTDSEGNFQVSGLEAGLYTVVANAPAYTSIFDPNAPLSYYRIGDSVRVELVRGGVITGTVTNALGEPVGEQLNNLTITLAEGAGSIRGKLALAEAPPGMVVYLVPSEQDKADNVLRFFVTEVGADGTFALNNLPPGRYFALTQTNADAQTATLTKLRQPETATARTKLQKIAATQKTEIELKPCQNLTDYELKL